MLFGGDGGELICRWLAAVGFQEIWNGFVDRAVIAGTEECRITLST